MMNLIIVIHVIVCALLITLILIQRGKGGGLLESFSDVESMFGTKTNTFLTRTTTILSVLFFITCLSLAWLSVRQSRSLMKNIKTQTSASGKTLPSGELPRAISEETPNPKAEEQSNVTSSSLPKQEQTQSVKPITK